MTTISIDSTSNKPVYQQIYDYYKQEIISGRLSVNSKLPSSRTLALDMQVSRNTVDNAFLQLLSEGFITSKPKSGYYVNDIAGIIKLNREHFPLVSDNSTLSAPDYSIEKRAYAYDFSPNNIDMEHFPYATWQKLSKECLYNINDLFMSGEHQGDYDFRQAICHYLHHSRGVNCDASQVIIGAGADYLLQLLCQILADCHDIAFENPAYVRACNIFKGFNFNIHPISLDNSGMRTDILLQTNAQIAYVTPSHQYPLGIVMPIKRRLELLNWANASPDRYIIEDDHDSEFRYKGRPIPALYGMDSNEKVIYLGTFSKSIAPAIRIGYLVLPNKLLNIYKEKLGYYSCTVSRVDQAILTHFIMDGYFERHVNRMRKIYKTHHDLLSSQLKLHPDIFDIVSEQAGHYIVIRCHHSKYSEDEIIELCHKNDINIYGMSQYMIDDDNCHNKPIFLLGFAGINEENIEEGVELLISLLVND